jgi:hypothetical protein
MLMLFAENAEQVRPSELLYPVAWATALSSAALFLITMIIRDARKAGMITTLLDAACSTLDRATSGAQFLYDHFSHLWVETFSVVKPQTVLIGELVLISILSVLIVRKLKSSITATAFLNVMAVVLLSFPIAQSLGTKWQNNRRPKYQPTPYAIAPAAQPQKTPDIYYIILDGYARSDIMKAFFNFDESPFLERLEKKGFYIARNSTANYCQTPLCLSSSLNSVYLDNLVRGLAHDQTELSDFIGKNNMIATLRPLGYKFISFATGFDPTEQPEADVYMSPYPHSTGFERLIIDETPLEIFWPDSRRCNSSASESSTCSNTCPTSPRTPHRPSLSPICFALTCRSSLVKMARTSARVTSSSAWPAPREAQENLLMRNGSSRAIAINRSSSPNASRKRLIAFWLNPRNRRSSFFSPTTARSYISTEMMSTTQISKSA